MINPLVHDLWSLLVVSRRCSLRRFDDSSSQQQNKKYHELIHKLSHTDFAGILHSQCCVGLFCVDKDKGTRVHLLTSEGLGRLNIGFPENCVEDDEGTKAWLSTLTFAVGLGGGVRCLLCQHGWRTSRPTA